MISNTTGLPPLDTLIEVVVIYGIFLLSVAGCILLSTYIVWVILSTNVLRSPSNVLVCNTGLATIFYIIISTINITCFVMETLLSDWMCRVQAYLSYASITMVGYSYLIQSISRLFFTVLFRYRAMRSYNAHIITVVVQIVVSFLIPLPSLVTQDIGYRFRTMCLIPARFIIHLGYFFLLSYFVPLFTVIIIYMIIYRRVKASSRAVENRSRTNKRDLQLARNILILFMIFLFSGFPGIIYILVLKITSWDSQGFYLFTLVSPAIASVLEKTSLIVLNRDIRVETRKRLRRLCGGRLPGQTAIEPFTLGPATVNQTLGSTTGLLRK